MMTLTPTERIVQRIVIELRQKEREQRRAILPDIRKRTGLTNHTIYRVIRKLNKEKKS